MCIPVCDMQCYWARFLFGVPLVLQFVVSAFCMLPIDVQHHHIIYIMIHFSFASENTVILAFAIYPNHDKHNLIRIYFVWLCFHSFSCVVITDSTTTEAACDIKRACKLHIFARMHLTTLQIYTPFQLFMGVSFSVVWLLLLSLFKREKKNKTKTIQAFVYEIRIGKLIVNHQSVLRSVLRPNEVRVVSDVIFTMSFENGGNWTR